MILYSCLGYFQNTSRDLKALGEVGGMVINLFFLQTNHKDKHQNAFTQFIWNSCKFYNNI